MTEYLHSPSAWRLADGCLIAWWYRYVKKVRQLAPSQGQIFGTLIHACFESHFKSGDVFAPDLSGASQEIGDYIEAHGQSTYDAMLQHAPERALAALRCVPDVRDVACIRTEESVNLTGPNGVRMNTRCRRDLTIYSPHGIHLIDLKSTKGGRSDSWEYVLSRDALRSDPQLLVYAADLMANNARKSVTCRWIYTLTDLAKLPAARHVDCEISAAEVAERLQPWWELGAQLNAMWACQHFLTSYDIPGPADTTSRDSPCKKYGGCPYHRQRGGLCDFAGERRDLMAFQSKLRERMANIQTSAPAPVAPAPVAAAPAPVPVAPAPVAPAPVAAAPVAPAPVAPAPVAPAPVAPAPVALDPVALSDGLPRASNRYRTASVPVAPEPVAAARAPAHVPDLDQAIAMLVASASRVGCKVHVSVDIDPVR